MSDSLRIAALVATHDRPGCLANRSLASIAAQTRPPDLLVVVDDSDAKLRRTNEEITADFAVRGNRAVYLENYRTPGASGAWNTALAYLQRTVPDCFVAILDDDDAWERTYLQRCEEAVLDRRLDMVAAGLSWRESPDDPGSPLDAPSHLDAGDFLTGNPHIQGSNLFVRLRTLLEAGAFDESLPSATDRDLCIRLADLGDVRFGPLPECLVRHYAEGERPRLSNRGSETKLLGLQRFYRKYRSRMSEAQRDSFLDRACRLFGYSPDTDTEVPVRLPSGRCVPVEAPGQEPLDLIVGVITSPDVEIVGGLLDDLTDESARHKDVRLQVLLLENGGEGGAAGERVAERAARSRAQGLDATVIGRERQADDLRGGAFGDGYAGLPERASIALARTMLQRYLYLAARERPGSVVWILDDDSRLDSLTVREDGTVGRTRPDIVGAVRRLKQVGAGVVIGEVTGEPPIPFSSAVRVQLVDLHHNLEALAGLGPDDPFPDRGLENAQAREGRRDFYYDLSRKETGHLETPFWYQPSTGGQTARQVFAEMAGRVPGILRGIQVFRPLVHSTANDPLLALVPSANRGPNTFVFDIEALRDFPNAAPSIGGSDTRRSDMVWSLLNRFAGGRKVVLAPVPIRQDRSRVAGGELDFNTLAQDIHGYAVCSALHDLFLQRSQRRRSAGKDGYGPELLEFNQPDLDQAERLFQKYLTERVNAFELSYRRIMGLLRALTKFTEPDARPRGSVVWWLADANSAGAAQSLHAFISKLKDTYTGEGLDEFRRLVQNYNLRQVREFYAGLGAAVGKYRAWLSRPPDLLTRARAIVEREFPVKELRVLGAGAEGAVFTDGQLVYKCIPEFTGGVSQRRLLESLAGRLDGCQTLCSLREVRTAGDGLIIVYPFEDSQPYRGGHLDEILTFLRECREAGIVSRNVHPDNFIVTSGGLKFIDYGRDIRPFSYAEFVHMCRRAFLAWRFHFRSDLKPLMRRALTEHDLPEFNGFDHFLAALDPRPMSRVLDTALLEMVKETGARTVLDYGCGRGGLARRLASAGMEVTGYDPSPEAAARWNPAEGKVEFLGASGRRCLLQREHAFESVLCSRVLCTLENPGELRRVLQDLRRLTSPEGTVLVAICNPFSYCLERTEGHERRLPPNAEYDNVFTYRERDPTSERWLNEVHRPLEVYRREFLNAGLLVERIVELSGSDTLNLRPASDYMVFRLKPAPQPAGVSLMIKTCFMEWKTIEGQVRHLVRQLEGPRVFAEKVVVVDPRVGPFTRQYETANPEAHRKAMARLLADGVVDRVVYAPQDQPTIGAVLQRWFGVVATNSHTASGQPVFATLWGLEQCESDYILQLDSDLLIGRQDRGHDYLGDMLQVFEADDKALFVPLSIFKEEAAPYTSAGSRGDWRVEVRGCLLRKDRVEQVLPIPNEAARNEAGELILRQTWHRACDGFIAGSGHHSYRGGDPRTFFIHVPNDRKQDTGGLLDIIDRVEQGFVPAIQTGFVDLQGSWDDWAGPKRAEPYIFLISGRNIDPGQFKRCFDSVLSQTESWWGAIVIDDASANGFGDYARTFLAPHCDRVTFIRNRERRGLMWNMWEAITRFCAAPQSVIVTLDPDDLLAGPRALERVKEEYEKGADVTVGSMLRLDKEALYPAELTDPRGSRGGNVWQHLRTFRKRLFDAIRVEDLKLDGEWIDCANDWAYMLPIVEMSRRPVYIPEPLYVYDPSPRERESYLKERDANISRIVARPRYTPLRPKEPDSGSRRLGR